MANLRKEAKGRECQVRIPGICTGENETVVLAHYTSSWLRGMGSKPHDIYGAYCCVACHNAIDGRVRTNYSREELRLMHAEGVFRTIGILLREGKICLTG